MGTRGGSIGPWNGAGGTGADGAGTMGELVSADDEAASVFFWRLNLRPDPDSSAGRFFGCALLAASLYSAQNSFLKLPLAKHSRSQSQIAHNVRPRLRSRGTLRKHTVVERTCRMEFIQVVSLL